MSRAVLIRTYKPQQTEGVLRMYDDANEYKGKLCMLEKPWKNNVKVISCIPEGTYECELFPPSKTFNYPYYRIHKVTGRSGICIHRFNYERESRGCPAPGMSFKDIDGDGNLDTKSSAKALDWMVKTLGERFTLVVTHVAG